MPGRTSNNITLSTFLVKRWLPAIEPTVRPSTFIGYDIHVRHHITPYLGRALLKAITGEKLNELYATLAREGSAKGKGGLKPATVVRVHLTLHRAFRDAVRWGYLKANPCDASDPPRLRSVGNTEMKTWTAVELATFLAAIKNHPYYPVYHLMAMTGLRRGEALGLRWCDVDLQRGQLAVRQTVLQLRTGIAYSTPKTAKGGRVVALDRRTVSILEMHRPQGAAAKDLVFQRRPGAPLWPGEVTKHFKRLIKQTGAPLIRLHDLRHTHATLALEAGIHPKIVSERLGHSSVAITMDVYSHAVPHMQTEAAAQLGELVFGSE
jgi:integrase